jgi:hypothetical protein
MLIYDSCDADIDKLTKKSIDSLSKFEPAVLENISRNLKEKNEEELLSCPPHTETDMAQEAVITFMDNVIELIIATAQKNAEARASDTPPADSSRRTNDTTREQDPEKKATEQIKNFCIIFSKESPDIQACAIRQFFYMFFEDAPESATGFARYDAPTLNKAHDIACDARTLRQETALLVLSATIRNALEQDGSTHVGRLVARRNNDSAHFVAI